LSTAEPSHHHLVPGFAPVVGVGQDWAEAIVVREVSVIINSSFFIVV